MTRLEETGPVAALPPLSYSRDMALPCSMFSRHAGVVETSGEKQSDEEKSGDETSGGETDISWAGCIEITLPPLSEQSSEG